MTFQEMLDRKMQEMTVEDLSLAIALKDYNLDVVRLMEQNDGNIEVVEKKTSCLVGKLVCFVFEDYLKDNGFDAEPISWGRVKWNVPTYQMIEYGPDKKKRCFFEGTFILRKNGFTYLFKGEPIHKGWIFSVRAPKNADPSAQVIVEDLAALALKNNFYKGTKITPNLEFIKFDKPYTWDDIVLADELKREIRSNIENIIENTAIFKKNNLKIKRGLIFSGPPGVGKTLLGKILCSMYGWSFIWVSPGNMLNPDSLDMVGTMARDLSPCILFLEDIDLVAEDRQSSQQKNRLGELLNQLDGMQENNDLIVLGTTNDISGLDKAIVSRPGRFDKVIDFGLPAKSERLKLLELYGGTFIIENKDEIFESVAQHTEGLSGAHMKEIVDCAILKAVDNKSWDADQKIILKKEFFEEAVQIASKKIFESKPAGFVDFRPPEYKMCGKDSPFDAPKETL